MRTWRLGPLLACCLFATACGGGDKDSDSGDNRSSGGVVTVRNGDRIAWDQPVESPDTARAYTYKLYVDGVLASLTEIGCADVRTAGGVACSGRIPSLSPGRHSLELTASYIAFESGRSEPLVVSMGSLAFITASTPGGNSPASPSAASGLSCMSAVSGECYETRVIASGLGTVTSLVATRHLVFVGEGQDRIRAVVENVLAETPAFVVEAGTRIVDIAVPPDFEQTRTVYVALSEPSRNGGEALRITRYRELAGALGEGATVVAGLPLPAGAFAPLAIDEGGLIYVALPAAASNGDPTVAGLSHFVLRFNPDGTLPSENPGPSPVIAQGYGRPSAIAWNRGSKELWLSGVDDRSLPAVSTLRIEDASVWPVIPVPATGDPRELSTVSSLALTHHERSGQLWLVTDGVLRRAMLAVQPPLRLDAIVLPGMEVIGRISASADGSLVVATVPGPGRPSEVWRLNPVTDVNNK